MFIVCVSMLGVAHACVWYRDCVCVLSVPVEFVWRFLAMA